MQQIKGHGNTKNRVAAVDLDLTRFEKAQLFKSGVAVRVWYGRLPNSYRLYVSKEDVERLGFRFKKKERSRL